MPAAVLGMRQRVVGGHSKSKVLVHDATWESYGGIDRQFPDFHLEDKVRFLGGSNDKPPLQFTYVRRKTRGRGVADVGNNSGQGDELAEQEAELASCV